MEPDTYRPSFLEGLLISTYSHPQIDGKVNHHQISRDLLFHLFGDDYNTNLTKISWD